MTRTDLQALVEERLSDAQCLLSGGRWAGAYYLAGYAVEAGLKSCVLAHIDQSGRLFKDLNFAKSLSGCWTHDLNKLIDLAGLKTTLDETLSLKTPFTGYWGVTREWSEISRYESKLQLDAEALIEAITIQPHGVLEWVKLNW